MRKTIFLLLLGGLAACNSSEPKVASMSANTDTTAKQDISYAYPVAYSSKFEMGDAKNSQAILNIWKSWDNGNLAATRDLFADSVEFHFASGDMDRGPRDSVMAHAQAYRNSFDSVVSRVDAVLAAKSTDKNEDWVCVWGMETNKDKKGKIDSIHLEESWRLNKDGKVDYVLQYNRLAKPRKM